VAMSVNDLVVQGAEPLFFLDYFACSKLDVSVAADVIKGIAEGCRQSGCALVGGETAEMPGMYSGGESRLVASKPLSFEPYSQCNPPQTLGDYDLAGFAVGAVSRSSILPKVSEMKAGDVLLGLGSSGVHSNGFSLVRKIMSVKGLTCASPCPWLGSGKGKQYPSLGHALLEPTRLYVQQVLPLCKRGLLKGMAHITGGGFTENIPRMLPPNLGFNIDLKSWELPEVFRWLKNAGNVESKEMLRTFNCGIGMVIVVAQECAAEVMEELKKNGEAEVHKIGVLGGSGVQYENLDSWA
jgi:phosphoribosylamine--glycine ligase/phosphoribosylformylglycinamidine cyclo-ligase